MKITKILLILLVAGALGMSGYYVFSKKNQSPNIQIEKTSSPSVIPTQIAASPTVYPNTKSAIQAFLANKYSKPLSEVKVTITKEVPGYASGSVSFGNGGPGEGGMWLAVLGNGWNVVWDGNGNVDCNKMRQEFGFPDAILKPNFCD